MRVNQSSIHIVLKFCYGSKHLSLKSECQNFCTERFGAKTFGMVVASKHPLSISVVAKLPFDPAYISTAIQRRYVPEASVFYNRFRACLVPHFVQNFCCFIPSFGKMDLNTIGKNSKT